MEPDNIELLDIEDRYTTSKEKGKSYLEEYLRKKWPGKEIEDLIKNKDNRTEIIMDLRKNTNLSIRAIADLLGINRGIVQKVKVNK